MMKKIYVLGMGHMSADKNLVLKDATPPDQVEIVEVPQICFLIETEDNGYLLFDCGPHHDAMNGRWNPPIIEAWPLTQSEPQRFINQLALTGVKPEEIKTVVISHLHQDHFGNIELFKHADVYVPKDDFVYAQTLVHSNPDRCAHEGYVKKDLEMVLDKPYHLVDSDFTLFPGIDIISLPGHTHGLLGMVVHSDNNTYIMPSDSIYSAEIFGPPARPSGTLWNEDLFLQSIEKVRALQQEYNAMIFFSHSDKQFATLKTAPEYYC